ncbi:LLM class flavin-dependent oxidoreductase [Mycetocola manganoxydans]|uniref:LLM class flavin-dependent oxidoreductase n=1 Tax=Mycetocola manganoxydans TaxID=699879 RepID=A0A3L6ZYJ8_9MICO|nr:LLM class flavin-dependent oxidoreductase [Mycetocola manganoxydans]RLP73113.1 LLM class flavin-dependent oxidoreductase [Mycetocola manganoxydans]GHD44042.1 monooxygenase [Mycetocola manganoxydans]
MSTEPKKLALNLFEMACVSHITHGLWVLEDNNRDRYADIDYWTELAQLTEAGGFDGIFLADVVGAYDVFRGGPETAIREGLQIPNLDPLTIVPAMAAVTKSVGFGVTFSTSYEPPFAFARRMSTLDHLTKGRMGWNIVTSYLPNAARNFGLDDEIPHDKRYEIADEYLDVLYKLWEGSWDDDAVVKDRQAGVFSDPAKVRYIHHAGENFRVAGPHLVAPSPQRTPVLYQATGSPAGIEFAGRHAEVVFTGGRSAADFIRNTDAMRDAAERHGRERNGIRFIVQAGVVTGRTDAEVERKLASYREHSSVDGILAHGGFAIDPTAYPRETLVSDILEREGKTGVPFARSLPPGKTAGDLVDDARNGREGRYFVAGTPGVVADEIERWLDEDGVDGINLRQYHSFGTTRDFVELVVPELRKRGRLREGYEPGETLRERLFGGGAHLPAEHIGARYRGGANLDNPVEPLRLGELTR